ncbi:MAG TPA: 2OG-Fe(II) oxygenase family protein [Woeseiaceae bacterium]|nr:2OG-Fe(II) oxygenase family protein [Woeseiaceae bacterium]
MSFHLSSSLNREAVHADFSNHGYAHIPSVLPAENAKRIHRSMIEATPWSLAFNDRAKHFDLSAAQLSSMAKHSVNQLQNAIFARARDSFQYCYSSYPIYDAYEAGLNKGHVLHLFYEWMNSEEFLGFARAATGFDDISFVDAQATRYMPGHFLSMHDDVQPDKNRRAAYIFNFTPEWRVDWGGYLQLIDESGHVRRGLAPSFNALNILAVQQKHNVSLVTPFAGGMRVSIAGWLRFGEKPKAPATSV